MRKRKKPKIKKVGESGEIDDVSFTLDAVQYTDERNEFADEDTPAEKVLRADVTIKNNSKETIPVGGDIKVYADGKQVESYPLEDVLVDSLSPGRTISGAEGFAINGNPDKLELEFQPSFSFSDKRIIYDAKPE